MAIESSTTTVIRRPLAPSIGLLLARIPIGVYFIIASAGKLRMGVQEFVDKTLPTAPTWLPTDVNKYYLGALPWVELSVGILIIIGLITRVAAGTISLMLISFLMAYGVRMQVMGGNYLPFHPNIVYLGTALAIMLCGPGWISLDGLIFRPRRKVIVTGEAPPLATI